MKKLTSHGFAALEAILIVVILAIIGGTGYYVYHATKKSNDTLNSAVKASQSEPANATKKSQSSSSQQFLTIKEWGIRVPYSGTDTFTYNMESNGNLISVLSKQVTAADPACSTYGAGQIARLLGSEDSIPSGNSGVTVAEDAAKNPGEYRQIGGYYYRFVHDQAGCEKAVDRQNQANQAVKALVSKLEPVPGS